MLQRKNTACVTVFAGRAAGVGCHFKVGIIGSQHPLRGPRSEEHTSELQSQSNLGCRLLLEKQNTPATGTPLYRSIQPALTNPYSACGATTAYLDLNTTANQLVCAVGDNGRGMATLHDSKPL